MSYNLLISAPKVTIQYIHLLDMRTFCGEYMVHYYLWFLRCCFDFLQRSLCVHIYLFLHVLLTASVFHYFRNRRTAEQNVFNFELIY